MWSRGVHRGALYPIAVKPLWRQTHKWTQCELLLYTGVCAILINGKFPNTVSHGFFRRLSGWNNSGAVKLRYQSIHKRFSTWINILVTRSLRLELLAEHWTFFKVPDAKCMNIRAAKIIKYVQSGHYCAKSSCIVFHSIVFYSKNILKPLPKPWQAKQFCWHLVNKGRNSN